MLSQKRRTFRSDFIPREGEVVKFCRSCGKELTHSSDQTCASCGARSVKATAFCRFCGHPTTVGDAICAHCGSAIKPLPARARIWTEKTKKQMKSGKLVSVTLVIAGVIAYVIFALPHNFTKAVVTAIGDAVMSSTGYTASPIQSIVAVPDRIPLYNDDPQTPVPYPPPIALNGTRQLTIYAVRIDASDNATTATRLDDVTGNCSFNSSDENIATVNASGFVQVRGAGQAYITAIYTAPAGTANMSNAAAGKIPTTFTVNVLVDAANDRPAVDEVP